MCGFNLLAAEGEGSQITEHADMTTTLMHIITYVSTKLLTDTYVRIHLYFDATLAYVAFPEIGIFPLPYLY
jgi:hypothetical protein